jgi:SAM-dependent methyltransferase
VTAGDNGPGDYFDVDYPDYALRNPPHKLAFYRSLIENAVRSPEPRVLELGCAFGRLLAQLPTSWRRFGLDSSERAIHEARRAVPGAALVVAGAVPIPFDCTFDGIFAFDVLEHLRDLEATQSTIRRRLEPGGTLIFVVPVYDGPLGSLVRRLDRDSTHVHKTDRGFWLEWTSRAFEIVTWVGVFRLLLPTGHYVHLPSRSLRAIAPAIAVVARRRPDGP